MGHYPLAACAAGLTTGLAAGVLAASYQLVWRRRLTTWGATGDEVATPMPGDELGTECDLVTTLAVAISAPPSCVWPWLVQIGSGRAGRYSYDWIENLFGLDMHSADVILPQFQQVKPGDEFPLGRRYAPMRIVTFDPERHLALCSCDGRWGSTFALIPKHDVTRLVSRNKVALPQTSPAARLVITLFMEPVSVLLKRKMLLGIKERAERLATELEFTAVNSPPADDYIWTGDHL